MEKFFVSVLETDLCFGMCGRFDISPTGRDLLRAELFRQDKICASLRYMY